MTVVLGADPRRVKGGSGWIVCRLEQGALREVGFAPSLDAVRERIADVDVLAVTVPVGHEDPRGEGDGRRRADDEARRRVGPHAEAVPWFPPLELLEATDLDQARARARAEGWPVPGEELWRLRAPLRDVDALVSAGDRLEGTRLVETHPEVTLQVMLEETGIRPSHGLEEARRAGGERTGDPPGSGEPDGAPPEHLEHPRGTSEGRYERLRLLHEVGLRPTRSLGGVGRASPKDVLDATAAAWSGHRALEGQAETLPGDPPEDPRTGRDVAIRA